MIDVHDEVEKTADAFLCCGIRRDIKVVGFLGISDYGFGQLEVLLTRYRVAFASSKRRSTAHSSALEVRLAEFCRAKGIDFLGAVDANTEEVVARARNTDLVVLGGYDGILRGAILKAPRYGVINTHLGLIPSNRGCFPTLWAQMHGLPQGFTTYIVGTEIDYGGILELYQSEEEIGGLRHTNGEVYSILSDVAVTRFAATLDRFEEGCALKECEGRDAYHRRGLPNDGWLSFQWSDAFLLRFSLALDLKPYLPGRTLVLSESTDNAAAEDESRVEVEKKEPRCLWLAVEGSASIDMDEADTAAAPGAVLSSKGESLLVRTREGAVRCLVRSGDPPLVGACLSSGPPSGRTEIHPVSTDFVADVMMLEPYLRPPRSCSSS